MPLYEYVCQKCERSFEELVFGSQKPVCPACHGDAVARVLSRPAATRGRGEPTAPAGCGTCGHPDGPGACRFES